MTGQRLRPGSVPRRGGWGPRARWLPVLLAGALVVSVASVAAVVVVRRPGGPEGPGGTGQPLGQALQRDSRQFLTRYVDDGRVVRLDEGGDTVSEGQAYGMLIAVALGDEQTFRDVWGWTRANLQRPDGLLSWRWVDGAVIDPSSASDADLDAARALVVAGSTFDDDSYTEQGVRLGRAVLENETVDTGLGRVLVAGQWARTPPYSFNPSYVSPVATRLLGEASGDPRWEQLERGSRAAVRAVTPSGRLPPDWAQVDADGAARPVPGPAGEPVRHGYDAARTLVRHAESCEQSDRAYAAQGSALLGDDRPAAAVYDLAGSPQTDTRSALADVARASALARAGRTDEARTALDDSDATSSRAPSYYGDAWARLGRILLQTEALGGCQALGRTG